ncbi:MAG: hypothetical protein PWP51_1501 [Clostridiales bacterium]|nr:hypothetical protein [Clostridiales bacterium]
MKSIHVNEIVCTLCATHCKLSIELDGPDGQIKNVYGSRCSRGYEYISQCRSDQPCMIPTSVRVNSHTYERLPVNSDAPLPKNKIPDAMMVIRNVEVTPPVKSGEIIIENILNTGVNIISTKSLL